ncbi:hypothetical protein ACF0H5_015046 [Mactra antiquata]
MLEPDQIKHEPIDIKQELDPNSTTGNSPKKKGGRPKKLKQEKITDHVTVKKKRKIDRFKGMPEEEVILRLLPDHLAPNLDIVIVGINPGLYAAFVGHHYAGPGNHFWKCMYLSGLIPEPMNAMQDFKLLEYGIGFTNIVARTTKGSADLSRKEIKEGAQILTEKLLKYKPKIAVFNGKGIYEVFVGHKNFHFGKQPDYLPGTETAVFVMPSSSARCSQLPRAVDKVPFYEALKKFRDHLNGKLPDLDQSEITFPDVFLKTAVKKEVKEEVKEEANEQYPGEIDPPLSTKQQLSQFVPGSFNMIPHTGQSSASTQESFIHSSPDLQSTSSTPQMCNTSPPSTVQIKQEPVDLDCKASSSQSDTISIGQFEVYNQSQGSTQNDSHLNNFLNGLYGLVGQVAGEDKNSSKYGMVSNTSMFSRGPVQFNDALRDIVKETDGEELDSCTNVATVDKPSKVQESQGKLTKSGRPRKRRSKTSESPQMPLATVSSPQGPQFGQSVTTTSPINQPDVPHTMNPYTSHLSQQMMGMPQYSNSFMSQMQGSFPPIHYTQPQHNFPPHMMANGAQAMSMMHNSNMYPYHQQPHPHSNNEQYSNPAGQLNGIHPNFPIKQEKPDDE